MVQDRKHLRADCKNCFGLCCVALYFSALEGFPSDKEAGQPCCNLQTDFRCSVHKSLKELGYKGCIAFDCYGAGQKVAQVSFNGCDWRKVSVTRKTMFEVFLIMQQLHEMLWYLGEVLELEVTRPIHQTIYSIYNETEVLTFLSPPSLLELDVPEHRTKVNLLLLKASELVRAEYMVRKKNAKHKHENTFRRGLDLMGKDLRKKDFRGQNLRGTFLIAADLRGVDLSGADLIGVDFRNADIRGANLSKSIFLTQSQVYAAKGDSATKLPPSIIRPEHWDC